MKDFKKQNPFKVPKGYFDQLEEQLIHPIDSISKLNPFSTPENYFEKLESALLQQTNSSVTSSKPSFKKIYYSITAAAAAILILHTLTQQQPPVETEREQALNEFIESYYLEDFDGFEVYSMLEESEIETTINQILKP